MSTKEDLEGRSHAGISCVLVALSLFAACPVCPAAQSVVRLDTGWRFLRGEELWHTREFQIEELRDWVAGRNLPVFEIGGDVPFTKPDFDDSAWREVRVPHDFGIDLAFAATLSQFDGCLQTTGPGWYRRRLDLGGLAPGGKVFFECDGAMSYPLVWINGHFAGGWCYGYTPFSVDLTPWVKADGDNVIAVRTFNPPGASRWYTGAGLYRECRLVVAPADHVVYGSVAITTPVVTPTQATVRVTWEMSESGRKERTFTVPNPRLWDVDDPYLYTVDVEGTPYRYGIRTIGFFPDERGFQLNGRRVQIRGMCLHHDFGAVGAAWNRSAAVRRLKMIRSMGANAIRMSHNTPAPQLLDLCDEMGFLVMNEVFDQWSMAKNPNDYWKLFPGWHEKDLRAWVRSGRNHPSVIIWGIGNEITESRRQKELWPVFIRLCDEMRAIVHEEDATRPVSAAVDNGRIPFETDAPLHLDIWGSNYKAKQYARFREKYPAIPLFGSETMCIISTRGEYFFPARREDGSTHMSPYLDFHASSYGWSGDYPADEEWFRQDETPSVMGDFTWTAFDYLGGPFSMSRVRKAPRYSDPAKQAAAEEEIRREGVCRDNMHSCPTGVFDAAGFAKDLFWLYQSKWRPDVPCAHILPHWNWPERIGENTPVYVYSSGDEVELFLNGVSLGRRTREKGLWRFMWPEVAYRPGELRAVAYRNGAKWHEETVRTTGKPARLVLEPEQKSIASDGEEFGFVTCRVVDSDGNTVPRTRTPVSIEVTGDGEFVAADNGDESDFTWYRSRERKAFNGCLSVVVRARPGAVGAITVRVSSEGLGPAEAQVDVVQQ